MPSDRRARSIAWYRTPVERKKMQALNRRSDWKALLQVSGHLSLIALTATLAWHVQDRLYLLLPVLFLYGTFYVFLLNATHELSHSSVFKTKFLNEFFLKTFCFMGWRSYAMFLVLPDFEFSIFGPSSRLRSSCFRANYHDSKSR